MRIRNPPKRDRNSRECEDADSFALKRGGIVIGMKREGAKERIYYLGEDSHLLCIGATRSGKSRCLVVESICTLGLAGESVMCSDPKGELYHYTLDVAITVLISIVLGALILGGLYLIVNSTVLPTITQKIKDMFNYKG